MVLDILSCIYNPYRNATDSWQGYHYQAQVALYFYLKAVQDATNDGRDPSKLFIRMEWLEDFIIFNGTQVQEVFQVKKTYGVKEKKEILPNFLFTGLFIDKSKLTIIYNQCADSEACNFPSTDIEDYYTNEIISKHLAQFLAVKENMRNMPRTEFNAYIELQLKNDDSSRGRISGIREIRSIVKQIRNARGSIEAIEENDLNIFIDFLNSTRSPFNPTEFSGRITVQKHLITASDSMIDALIENLRSATGPLEHNDSLQTDEIRMALMNLIYTKLMSIEDKNIQPLDLAYEDLQNVFLGNEHSCFLWNQFTGRFRNKLLSLIEEYCENDCAISQKDCSSCAMKVLADLKFEAVIDDLNLEHPIGRGINSLRNKFTDNKAGYYFSIFQRHLSSIQSILQDDKLLFQYCGADKAFISLCDGNPFYQNSPRGGIIRNFEDHINIYEKFQVILTQYFDDHINADDFRSIKDPTSNTPPHFMDILPLTFISNNALTP